MANVLPPKQHPNLEMLREKFAGDDVRLARLESDNDKIIKRYNEAVKAGKK